ncbi:hypothetical protein V12G01_14514 [Vibrio alginolyticus 12G01]|uniref:hypothetical protein n=1 Tax=Vibrio TaxID=662 RepID=UPI0000D53472|nr:MULTISPECIES: hypothetical protein [Vibrio]ELA7137783.1 hypothetical protein [Vibrio parahaemolyticus]EAS76023.1 hypothetical protein V12G01_14514 [Vibrio alginolyticus 12G01]ELB2258584.1 hypothetical protein [Vibrio parahaemolyticus]MCS0072383.1 hypothetical protein [Vibrio alginolyticus]MDW1917587.1 hypothetical protein [Vibrio sp. Vb0349]
MSSSNELKVIELTSKISALKDEYSKDLTAFIQTNGKSKREKLNGLLKVQSSGNKYFNYIEDLIGDSGLLGAHEKNGHWLASLIENTTEALNLICVHYVILRDGVAKFSDDEDLLNSIEPTSKAFSNMQRLVSSHLKSKEWRSIKSEFEKNSLPTYGFNNRRLPVMNSTTQTVLSFIFGVVFVIVLLAIAFIEPDPSSFQYNIFRVVLALAAAGVVAVLPGFIEVKFGKWLRATGALAVFVIVYFYNPASLVSEQPSERPPIEQYQHQ